MSITRNGFALLVFFPYLVSGAGKDFSLAHPPGKQDMPED
jgi:hypothetical protein